MTDLIHYSKMVPARLANTTVPRKPVWVFQETACGINLVDSPTTTIGIWPNCPKCKMSTEQEWQDTLKNRIYRCFVKKLGLKGVKNG